MVGYSEESKAYPLYSFETRKLIKSRDVIFVEQTNYPTNNTIILDEINIIVVYVDDLIIACSNVKIKVFLKNEFEIVDKSNQYTLLPRYTNTT